MIWKMERERETSIDVISEYICWVEPPHGNSHNKDFMCLFFRGDPYRPTFATVDV